MWSLKVLSAKGAGSVDASGEDILLREENLKTGRKLASSWGEFVFVGELIGRVHTSGF